MKSAHAESVLVVDDDVAIRSVLCEILSREGYDVSLAENGAQALDTMRHDHPDVVVLDLMMPVMSGWELLVAADEDESLRDIPILVASAMAAPVASPERHGGVRTCLAKPLDIPLLLEALRMATTRTPTPPVSAPRSVPSSLRSEGEHTLRVLMVEDSVDDADLIKAELRRAKYAVHTVRVETKEELVLALEREPWDVILSDMDLPGFSGRAALEIVLAHALDVPFIVISGTVGEDVAVECMKAGAHDFFPKRNLSRLGPTIARELRAADRRNSERAERSRAAAELERLLCDLRAAVKVRDDFLSIASHELKTPITSLQLEVQLLRRQLARDGAAGVAEKLDGKLVILARQITRLTTLVNDLLDVARHAPEESAISREPLDLEDVVRAALCRCDDFIRASGSALQVSTVSVKGSWDPARVESCVRNLLTNAVKYGEGRPIEVTLDQDGANARFIVVDHGIGIDPAEESRIFEKFERAVPLEHFGGFGLGLWSARQAVVAHGGEIRCESQKGSGSKFTVLLPLTAAAP